MKVAFIIGPTVSGRQNGIVSQALTWKRGLEEFSVSVDLVTPWETYPWNDYDVVHAFGIGSYLEILPKLKEKGASNIVLSPIYDSNRPEFVVSILSNLDVPFVSCNTIWATFKKSLSAIDLILTRSEFETIKLTSIFNLEPNKVKVCRLPTRFSNQVDLLLSHRKDICAHVSVLSAQNKNVLRLIEAAKKYNFTLVLAGHINNQEFSRKIEQIVAADSRIMYLGVLTDDELIELYKSCRVFALPSLMEGVGLVALEAAQYGADIVITNRGGPKEYFGAMSKIVDPLNVEDIGRAVRYFMDGNTYQPELSQYIFLNNTVYSSAAQLLSFYKLLI